MDFKAVPRFDTGLSDASQDTKRDLQSHRDRYEEALKDFEASRKYFERKTAKECGEEAFILIEPFLRFLRTVPPEYQQEGGQSSNYWDGSLFDRLWKSSQFSQTREPPRINLEDFNKFNCSTLFLILIDIREPRIIHEFVHNGFSDASLPLDDHSMRTKMGRQLKIECGPDYEQVIARFLEAQYKWCPVTLDVNFARQNLDKQILPFYAKKPLTPDVNHVHISSTNSCLWRIDVPEECVSKDLQSKFPHARLPRDPPGDSPQKTTEWIYRFVLKEFPGHRELAFDRERTALKALAGQKGVIDFIGWYVCTNKPSANDIPNRGEISRAPNTSALGKSCCILLELGDGDFNQYMRKEPPKSHQEIWKYWKSLSGIAEAIVNIHNFKIDGTDYHGWHGDIKPDNILHVLETFKLSDPGEARILRQIQKPNGPILRPRTSANGGGRKYAAPEKERYINKNGEQARNKVLQTSDVWSFGCVLSVAATYVVHGQQGPREYNKLRESAIEQLNNAVSPDCALAGDAFHDGSQVLACVTNWHKYLQKTSRRSDPLTTRILDMVDSRMLTPESGRETASWVFEQFNTILDETKCAPEDDDLTFVQQFLTTLDQDAGSRESILDRTGEPEILSLRERFYFENQYPTRNSSISSSEQLFHSVPVGTTAQRSEHRPGSKRSRDNQLHLMTRMSGDPGSPVEQPPWLQGESELGPFPFPLATVTGCDQVLEELKKIGKGWKLRELRKMKPNRKAVRRLGKAVSGLAEMSIRGKTQDDPLEGYFTDRDLIFLVDNSSSMRLHWEEAKKVLKVLVWRALGYDDNGLELYFTDPCTRHKVEQGQDQNLDAFLRAMDDVRPNQGKNFHPDITAMLHHLVNNFFMENCGKSSGEIRKKTIIVLTDAVWEAWAERAVDSFFSNLLERLRGYYSSINADGLAILKEERPVTVQFVRFGYDAAAQQRLERWDNCFEEDMIDTEPSHGDVYKMLLGSLDPTMDNKVNGANYPRSPIISSSQRVSRVVSEGDGRITSPTGTSFPVGHGRHGSEP